MKTTHTQKIYRQVFILILFFSSVCLKDAKAQMVYMPDYNFRNFLINHFCAFCIVGDSIDSSSPYVSNATALNVGGYYIQSIEGIQAFGNLQQLICSNNQLTSLPSLPTQLIYLNCQSNQLVNLPSLPTQLIYLDCSFNNLVSIPTLPTSLTHLYCENNQLNNLPLLPNSLTELACYRNLLTNLPALPTSLTSLNCANNQLTNLPSLPNSLTGMICNFNQLTTLPAIPASLIDIECTNNQLVSLPEFPDSMHYFSCSFNPNLNCLPRLKRMMYLQFFGTSITCLPNSGNVTNSLPLLSSVPLCGLYNPDSCSVFSNISGKIYFDSDTNCILNSYDALQRNTHIMLYKNGNLQQQIVAGEGLYSFDLLDTGNYAVKLDTSNIAFDLLCPLNNSYNDTITATDSLFYDNDFALKCKTGFDVVAWSIVGRFSPASLRTVRIAAGDISNFYGVHCATGISGTVTVVYSGPVSYVSPAAGAIAPTTVNGDTIAWNVADFGTTNFFSDFNIIMATDTNATLGSQVCITASVLPIAGDNNPSNNTLTHCFTIVNSIDPNEKEVDPVGDVDVSGNRWLTYTIHFQNTGTAPAQHIYITDTLDANLDLSTFQLLAYSHQPIVQILDGGIARFNFPNINLPDSNTNEPASHGYIQYKIKLKSNTAPGAQIQSTAYIYFDFNTPVVTNTTSNTVTNIVGIATAANTDLQFTVYPNPSHGEFTVYSSRFTVQEKILLKIFNAIGEELYSTLMQSANCTLHTANLPKGIYFLRMETEQGVAVKKLVKE